MEQKIEKKKRRSPIQFTEEQDKFFNKMKKEGKTLSHKEICELYKNTNLFNDRPLDSLIRKIYDIKLIKRVNNKLIFFTEEQDELIKEFYSKKRNPIKELKNLPQFRDITDRSIRSRACNLNVNSRHKKLSKQEKEIIDRFLGTKSPEDIVKIINKNTGLKRKRTSLYNYVYRQKIGSSKPDLYSVNDVSVAIGCSKRRVISWINRGMLAAKMEGTKTWRIKPIDVCRMIVNNPYEINKNSRPDIPWLIALLDEFRAIVRKESPHVEEENSINYYDEDFNILRD